MRLIDADILKSAIVVDGYEHFSGCLSSSEVALLEMVKDDIDETPTVDAVPVVRCQDCVNCLIDNTERKYHLCMRHSSVFPRKVDLMDFCSYGERKEGADHA